MTRLRIAHRLWAAGAIGAGLVVLRDGFTGDLTAHPAAALIWLVSSAGVVLTARRMRVTAYRDNHQTPEENR